MMLYQNPRVFATKYNDDESYIIIYINTASRPDEIDAEIVLRPRYIQYYSSES